MKRYLLVAALLMLILNNLFGEVKNGYEKNVIGLKFSLQSLKHILLNNPHLSAAEKRNIKAKIESTIDYLACYEITDRLLKQFREISPDLYNEMDTLKDSEGRIVDVYVKFLTKKDVWSESLGTASFNQDANDLSSCNSEYGAGSVSVRIRVMNKGLCVLSHEFGHLKYMVPNLKSYSKFYQRKYGNGPLDPTVGHRPGDPSGKVAAMFERRFRKSYYRYLKQDFEAVASPLALINPIKRNIMQNLYN